jgi:hypothetical protein
MLVQASQHDPRFKAYYERVARRRGAAEGCRDGGEGGACLGQSTTSNVVSGLNVVGRSPSVDYVSCSKSSSAVPSS